MESSFPSVNECEHGNPPGQCRQCRDEQLGRRPPPIPDDADVEPTVVESRPRGAQPDDLALVEAELIVIESGSASMVHEKLKNKIERDTGIPRNEDTVFSDDHSRTYGVLDGMGGHAAGDVASQTAAASIGEEMGRMPAGIRQDGAQVADYVRSAVVQAHGNIKLKAEHRERIREQYRALGRSEEEIDGKYPSYEGMGTTCSLVHLVERPDGSAPREAVIAQVGDSRVYLLRHGTLQPITKDLSLIQYDIDAGRLPPGADQIGDPDVDARLTEEQRAFVLKHRNVVTTALGIGESLRIDVARIALEEGDVLFATSDGIHDNLTDREIAAIAAQYPGDPGRLSQELTTAARARARDKAHVRKKDDDISAIAVRVTEQVPKADAMTVPSEEAGRWERMPADKLAALIHVYRDVLAAYDRGEPFGEQEDPKGVEEIADGVSRANGLRDAYRAALTTAQRDAVLERDRQYKAVALKAMEDILRRRQAS